MSVCKFLAAVLGVELGPDVLEAVTLSSVEWGGPMLNTFQIRDRLALSS